MNTTSFSRFVLACAAILFAPAVAHADEPAQPEAPTAPRPSESRTGRGVAFGVENGLFGRAFEQGLKLRIPVLEHWDVGLRGISTFGEQAGDTTWYVGGRLDIVGHSPTYLNLVRLYGGGGPEVFAKANGVGDKLLVGGGGHFGFEFFLNPKMSFYAEIGGHGGNELTAGGTAIAGMMLYPFSGP